jgi:hypothetical protein
MRQGDRGYNGVFLGWYRTPGSAPAQYSISFPTDTAGRWQLTGRSTIELSIAAMNQDAPLPPGVRRPSAAASNREAVDFTVELVASNGATVAAPVSQFAAIPPPLKEKFTKVEVVERDQYDKDWEPVFQTIRIPLSALVSRGAPRLDVQKLVGLRLKFDRTATSVICISVIGFGAE